MRYEIIKDKGDLYVLVINNIVVLISRDISAITAEIAEDVANRLVNPKRWYVPAIIDTNEVTKEDKVTEVRAKSDKEGATISLGKLFSL